jgi:DNA-directed RNA polymerase specialized sigma24 family protein
MLRGDEAQLFRDYEVALRCAVRHAVCATEAIIEDACSHAWLQLCRTQPDRDNIFAWLRTVAIREGWRLAARQRRDRTLETLPGETGPCAAAIDDALRAREALATLAALPERQRRYLTLIVSGCSYDEIVRHCATTTTNVNKHLCRARRHLNAVRDDS